MLALLRHIEADKDDIAAVSRCNHLILREILHSEAAILRHRERRRELTRALKIDRPSKASATALRTRLKRIRGYIRAQEDAVFIWKCFGDALAFLFLDKFSIKHAFFELDKRGIKRGPGMLTGKSGLNGELAYFAHLIAEGIPAVLCDITNILRYGDVCMLGASDPQLIEVKSSDRLSQRAKRQIKKLKQLHGFLADDYADDFRGSDSSVTRMQLTSAERTNLDQLNVCIRRAKEYGHAVEQPEPGVTYLATYGHSDFDAILGNAVSNAKFVFLLNSYKNDHAWSPYTPFLLTIRDAEHVLDFVEGRLYLIVFIDPQPLCDALADVGWDARFRNRPDYAIQCIHRPSRAFMGISNEFVSRVGYEFVSLAWIAENQRLLIAKLEAEMERNSRPDDRADRDDLLRAFIGEGDPWLEDLGLA